MACFNFSPFPCIEPFWTSKKPYSCPWCVGKLLKARDEVRNHILYKVGVESKFLLWHEPWLRSSPILTRYGPDIISIMESNYLAKICTIIRDGSWHPHPSNHMTAMGVRNEILGTRLFARDEILWDGHQSKWVTLSLIWNSIRRIGQAPPWVNAVWSEYSIPKNSFFFWLAIQNRLLTKDRMRRFGMQVNENCTLCGVSRENAAHLFTTCRFSRNIFEACPIDLLHNWQDYMLGRFFPSTVSKVQEQVAFLFIASAIYYVWQERNIRIHQDKKRSSAQIIFIIKREVRERLFSCSSFKRKVARDRSLLLLLF
ncbi:hypothetical protein POM88_021982 [Heracleum sosnowskyi]|uniref:Reverse transcriptase zinc-binding domain-containing protein n=1 Tax=Heracleum sosnowskyi TaxID=360622 RepID=A0AAD8IE58_9APIA|nr:hypothetical protein POM88_021982 [Heracleum sosnowskyi]